MSNESDSSSPRSFEEAQALKERLRREKDAFFAGLSDEAIAELEKIHRSAGKNRPKRSFQRYQGFDGSEPGTLKKKQ